MSFAELIQTSREYLSRFDYDDYPLCFQEFEQKADPLFSDLEENQLPETAETLIRELEAGWASLRRGAAKAAKQQDRQILALFLSPAAQRHSPKAEQFAGILQQQWCTAFPRYRYYAGNFEAIMKGFDNNIMGLTLRKSKKRG